MIAYPLYGVNDLRYLEVENPSLQKGWVLLEMKAAGICGSDIPRIYSTGTYHFPTIPGHEFSGIVRAVAEEDRGNPRMGRWIDKRAGVFPLIPCMQCEQCRAEQYEMCAHYNYLGSRTDGGFAEYVAVPEWNLIELPQEVSYVQAAMLEPMAVALHALRQIPNIEEKKNIAIFGAGPIGMMMAQWAKILGIGQVILITNKREQQELAARIGIDESCNSREEDPVAYILGRTEGFGASVTVDCIGASEIRSQCIQSTCAKGNVLLVGNPKGEEELSKDIYWKILRKQLRLYGTWNSSFKTSGQDDWLDAVEAMKMQKMHAEELVTHKLAFEELEDGLKIMKDKTEYCCKVMITR